MTDIDPRWRDHAACRELPTNMFYPGSNDHQGHAIARSICRAECPVVLECLEDALATGETEYGVRGGLGAKERRTLLVNRRRRERRAQAAAS